ncbi:MAG: DUF115 domain-containing protein [Hyphomonadaceae bacterium]|nr:DUF115 domain-containing protein [Hyphomonadaceae bacterium]
MSRLERLLSPVGLGGIARSHTYRALRDPSWTFSPRALASRRTLRDLHNSQAGAHGFIIGTGPSLKGTDFSQVRGHPCIGLNRLFLGFEDFGITPDFLACVNPAMIEQSAEHLGKLPCTLVTSWAARAPLGGADNALFLRTLDARDFRTCIMDAVATGGTVTYVAMQFAYWLGWSKVTLLGIDHSYDYETHEARLSPHTPVQRRADDTNHFTSDYFPKGDVWQLPDLKQSEEAYHNARKAYEAAGRQIVDGTVGGQLTVFPKRSEAYAALQPAT